MQLILGNPWGLLGLLGIPTILVIHLLQRQSKPHLSTTLFLLRHLQPESRAGRRVDRIRNSLPLWLQLLTVLILTWLLVDPRWRRAESIQRVAIVLDSSLSMEAYRDGIIGRLKGKVEALTTAATATEWHVLESDIRRPALYSGRALDLSYPIIETWHPRIGAHDLRPALGNARRLVGEEGVVIFLSDREATLPPGVLLLNVGDPFSNGGFAGLRVLSIGGVPHWEALVRNYGDTPQQRTWWLESDGTQTAPARIDLGPGAIQQLRGPFPKSGSDRLVLRMDPDRFPIDDALPIVKPQPKPIAVATGGAAGLRDFYSRLQESIPNIIKDFSEPDIMIDHYRPSDVDVPYCTVRSVPPPQAMLL